MCKIKVECSMCEGTGTLPQYKRIENGKCFSCNGKGFNLLTQEEIDKLNESAERMEQMELKAIQQEKEDVKRLKHLEEAKQEQKESNFEAYKEKLSYYGSIGETIELNSLELKKRIKTKFNYIYILIDKDGHSFKFNQKNIIFTSNNKYNIKATVKAHNEYEGYKQTELNKVEILNKVDIDEMTDEQLDECLKMIGA